MRLSSLLGPTAELAYLLPLWPIVTHLIPAAHGINFTPVPAPDLDLSQLGRVALTGDFDSVSLYTYQQQSENSFSTNGTQSLITQLPNGDFQNAANADGYIKTMCPFVMQDGTFAGIIVGGNFTSLGGVQAQGVAMYKPTTGQVAPLSGLTGQVNTLLCDQSTNTVYVGGTFKGANSSNAVAWVGSSGWANLPFEGFNGPVNSIIKTPNNTVVFGGSFTGLGNSSAPAKQDQQIINIASANLSTGASSTTTGYDDPSNIVCKTGGVDNLGSTWLLKDNLSGYWRADMNFGYEPSMLRIWNTHLNGRGTQTFRFTAIPLNGIMNFTYTDPDTGESSHCDATCPLSSNPQVKYQDFRFINTVGMSAFRIDISAWYGDGGGLDGIELFQNDIFAYAETDLNEPTCANIPTPSNSTVTGPWTVMPSADSNSRYLSATLSGSDIQSEGLSVVFQPDIKQKGNYSVTMFTPGCLQDNSCDSRGIVNVTGSYANPTAPGIPTQTLLYQTNNYDKYDVIYTGPVDINDGVFQPSVTLSPSFSQSNGGILVAQRVQFALTSNSSGELNGLYEFDPNNNSLTVNFTGSTIDEAGASLNEGATVTSIAVLGNTTYVAGNFSDVSAGFENVFAIGSGNSTSLPNGGLNARVSSLYVDADTLYIGGNFTDTVNGSVAGLNNIAAFNTTSGTWQPLGAGVNGAVNTIVSITVNVTVDEPEVCISFNGFFDQLEAFGSNKNVSVQGLGIWVPSQQNWLQNLNLPSQSVAGQLSAMTSVTNGAPLLAGTLSSQDLSASDAIALIPQPIRLTSLKLGIQQQPAGPKTQKRALATQNVSGIVTGIFHTSDGINVTVLGGSFTATATNGSTINNLAFLNSSGTVTGLAPGVDTDSTFLALASTNSILYAGGSVTGKVNGDNVNGLIVYDLDHTDYSYPQPPPLGGNNVVVNAITMRPDNDQVFVGGSFDQAGSLGCPSVCIFENGAWSQPGGGLGGIVSAMIWQGNSKLLVGGNLTVENNVTTLANYDAGSSQWSVINGAAAAIPGPVTALTPADNDASQFWVAGQASNGTAFLMKYDGSSFNSVGDVLGNQTTIRGLSVLQLSKNQIGNNLVPASMTLLVTGELNLPIFGNASAALFNGTTFTPFILSTSNNGPGSLSQLFSEKQVNFQSLGRKKALGLVVLIALACALGAIFLLVVAGILIERYRRKHEGYTPAPNTYFDKTSNMTRIPPEHLFGRLGQGRQQAPML